MPARRRRHRTLQLAVLQAAAERVLRSVPGIGPRRLGPAVESWREGRELRELRLFLDTHGVDGASASRIARHFGAGSIARLQREPYAICELDGIGFATARIPRKTPTWLISITWR